MKENAQSYEEKKMYTKGSPRKIPNIQFYLTQSRQQTDWDQGETKNTARKLQQLACHITSTPSTIIGGNKERKFS